MTDEINYLYVNVDTGEWFDTQREMSASAAPSWSITATPVDGWRTIIYATSRRMDNITDTVIRLRWRREWRAVKRKESEHDD